MGRLWPASLFGRLSIAYLIPAVVFIAGLIVLADRAARATLEEEVGGRLEATAASTAALLPTGLVARFRPDSARTHSNLLKRLKAVAAEVGARRVFLVGLDGRSMADTADDAPAPGEEDRTLAQDQFELAQVALGERSSSILYTGLDGVRYKRGFAPVRHEGAVVAVVGVEASTGDYADLDALSSYMVGIGLFALVAMGFIGLGISRALATPLARLAEAARKIGAGELEVPVQVRTGAQEIQILSGTMDEMRDALQRRERELQLMLGGIAHEIRNPLGGMELFVGLLKEDLVDQPDLHQMVARVGDELDGLKQIVEDFLAYARRAPIQRGPVALIELAMEVQGLVSLTLNCDLPTSDFTLVADRPRLRRLLLNLVGNAEQAGATEVVLKAAHHDTLPEGTGAGWVVTLTDDGPGIPEEAAARIFDAFYTTREKGTGLGLALCRRIAEEHGGALTLLNPGEPGARLQLVLPEALSSLRGPMVDSESAQNDRVPLAETAPVVPPVESGPVEDTPEGWLGDGQASTPEGWLGDGEPAMLGDDMPSGWLGDGEGDSEAWLGDDEPALLGDGPMPDDKG
ncbi:MAG: ATP-binding protein [Bradymonadia bacterium]